MLSCTAVQLAHISQSIITLLWQTKGTCAGEAHMLPGMVPLHSRLEHLKTHCIK